MVIELGWETQFGAITIGSKGGLWLPGDAFQSLRVRHTLPLRLAIDILEDAVVELDVTGPVGRRRFWPADNHVGIFQQWAFAMGLQFLKEQCGLDEDGRDLYLSMKYLFDYARISQRYIDRALNRSELRARGDRSHRGSEQSLLDPNLGLNAQGMGKPWSAERLIQEGRHRAAAEGAAAHDEESAIIYGLFAAAELNPFTPNDMVDSNWIVRHALYNDAKFEAAATPDVVKEVGVRWLQWLAKRSCGTWEMFRNSLLGPNKRIAADLLKCKGSGMVLTKDQVNVGLAAWGWIAYECFARCLDFWAARFEQTLQETLAEPLTQEEHTAFEFMYRPQAYFGGLPPILFAERLALLEPVWPKLEVNPHDPYLIGVAQRMLYYFGRLMADRREVDRNKKQNNKKTDVGPRGAIIVARPEVKRNKKRGTEKREDTKVRGREKLNTDWEKLSGLPRSGAAAKEELAALARDLLTKRGIVCPFGCRDPLVDVVADGDGKIDVSYSCSRHDWSGETLVTGADLRSVAEKDETETGVDDGVRRPRPFSDAAD